MNPVVDCVQRKAGERPLPLHHRRIAGVVVSGKGNVLFGVTVIAIEYETVRLHQGTPPSVELLVEFHLRVVPLVQKEFTVWNLCTV